MIAVPTIMVDRVKEESNGQSRKMGRVVIE